MTDQTHILLAEDDEAIATALAMNLKLEGYRLTVSHDGEEAICLIDEQHPDLILLDIGMPKRDGLEILEHLRKRGDQTPILILSARGSESDKVAALRLGADDYVTKPFALAELMARIHAVLRRYGATTASSSDSGPASDSVRRFGANTVDIATRAVHRGGEEVKLTHLEFELLRYFLDHPARVLSRDQILRSVWATSGSRRTVDNFVAQLRSKLEENPDQPRHFITVRGSGYRFDP